MKHKIINYQTSKNYENKKKSYYSNGSCTLDGAGHNERAKFNR